MYESSCSYQTALDLKRAASPLITHQVKSEDCLGLTQCTTDWGSYRFHQSTFEQLKQSVEKAKAALQDRTAFLGSSSAFSEDEQDELGENDDELDNVDTLNELEPGVGSWVLVKFVYGKRDSRHIGKITSKAGGDYLGSFLRKSTKKSDIFVFPDVSDERAFASQDVIITLKEPSVRRGRYSFEPNPLI
ncbi:hypothetical protein quinque_002545 [Culex quinquefasciatus]